MEKRNNKHQQPFLQLLYNIKTDFCIKIYQLKAFYMLHIGISAIQAKTFTVMILLHEHVKGKRKNSKQFIINAIMDLQTLMIVEDTIDYSKIIEYHMFYNLLIDKNDQYQMFNSSRIYTDQVRKMMRDLYLGLSHNEYLNEIELKELLNTKLPNKRK